MIKTIKTTLKAIAAAGAISLLACQWAAAGSLYEYYASASTETLKTDTGEMGSRLAATFDQDNISARQQRIDFAEYYANLKKMVLYADKLSTYSEYGRDLRFARDNEVFKGLPAETGAKGENVQPLHRKDFVNKKFGEMKRNVEEEIETYVDLITISLDVCETLTQNDLSGFTENRKFQGRMATFKRGKEYEGYLAKRARLAERWPSLAARISSQISLWEQTSGSPDEPLINTKIAGAI